MKRTKTKPNFVDRRGEIRDLLSHEPIDAITYITCAKGAVRGNHYHKKTIQYDYVLKGEIRCVSKDMKTGRIARTTLRPGDLVYHPANEAHAFEALKHSIFLSFTRGPRNGTDFEKDTVRLEIPLIKSKKK
jgi:quercetin dioxygenase-like cupin family protein